MARGRAAEKVTKKIAVETVKSPMKRKNNYSEKKSKKQKPRQSYSRFIYKILREIHPDISISTKAMGIMNDCVYDFFERLASEGSRLCHQYRKPTLTSREIQTAVRLTLPGELCQHAMSEGVKAITKFNSYKENDN